MTFQLFQRLGRVQPWLLACIGLLGWAASPAVASSVVAWGQLLDVPSDLTNAVSLSARVNQNVALTSAGTVRGWGADAPQPPEDLTNAMAAVAGDAFGLALRSNNTVVVWGIGNTPAGLTNVVAIAASEALALGVLNDGTVREWRFETGLLTNNLPQLRSVVAVSGGVDHSLALRSDGTIFGWGSSGSGAHVPPVGLSNAVAITSGKYHSLALLTNGTVVGWGNNDYGQLVIPTTVTNVVAIAAGWAHSFALRRDGSLVGWGDNGLGQLSFPPSLTNVTGIAAGDFHSLALSNAGNPAIVRGPVAAPVYSGSRVLLNVGAVGTGTLRYQWFQNSQPLSAATNATYAIAAAGLTNTGDYHVVVTNQSGSVTSAVASVTVSEAGPFFPVVLPTQRVEGGTTLTLAPVVLGSLPLSFQWRFNGTNLPGATAAVLSLANVQISQEGSYQVVASNLFGVATNEATFVDVVDLAEALNNSNLVWTTTGNALWRPQTNYSHDGMASAFSGIIGDNQSSTLQTTVNGPGLLKFWWYTDTVNGDDLKFSINGSEQQRITGYSLWSQPVTYLGVGPQTLTWTYQKDGAFSTTLDAGVVDEVEFIPGATAPFVTTNLTPRNVFVGTTVTLSAGVNGTPPLALQWLCNGTNLPGATTASLTLSNLSFANEGVYQLIVTNDYGATNTATAFVNVLDFAEAAGSPGLNWTNGGNQAWFAQTTTTHDGIAALRSGAITANQQSTLQTAVTGPGTLSFWWLASSELTNDYGSFAINGVEQARLSGNSGWQQRTHYLEATNVTLLWRYTKNGSVNSGSDAVFLDEVTFTPGATATLIAVPPSNLVTRLLTNATLQFQAGGTPPLQIQWQLNGSPLPNATNQQLTLSNVLPTDLGGYSVTVSNALGGLVSSTAQLSAPNVYAWGAGTNGLGTGQNLNQSVVPLTATNVIAVAAGGTHSLALRPDGRVLAWGNFSFGQTNVPSTLTNAVAIAAGFQHSVALRSNGTAVVWGNILSPPATATNLSAIAAGWFHALGLRSNGTVVAWGAGTTIGSSPNFGQSIVPTGLSNVMAIAAGDYHSLALRSNGTVIAWGWNVFGQTNVPAGLTNVVAIAAGSSNSIALKSDGTLSFWGGNGFGQTNVPTAATSNLISLTAGAGHITGLRNDGRALTWGLGTFGQTNLPTSLSNFMAVAAGGFHSLGIINLGPVAFFTQPRSLTIYESETATFFGGALGQPMPQFQWFVNGNPIAAATNQSLVLPNAQTTNAGSYFLVATQASVVITSAVAQLTVLPAAPTFAQQPTNQLTLADSTISFLPSVNGVAPIFYQWRRNGTNLVNQTNLTLTLTGVTVTNEGNYTLLASNVAGVATSDPAFLDILDLGEALNATNLTWTTGTNPPWLPTRSVTHDGVAAAGITLSNFNQFGYLSTTVVGPATLTFWWRIPTLTSPTTFTFRSNGVTAASASAFSLSNWQQQKFYLTPITNALEWWFESSSSIRPISGYLDEISITPGGTGPLVVTGLSNRTVPAGTNVTLSPVMEGTPGFRYQWQFNAIDLPGATNGSLSLLNVQAATQGLYTLTVTNDYGVTNTSMFLTVTDSPPVIWTQPTDKEMVRGGTVLFDLVARGTDPLSYQWQFGTQDIPGATNPSLLLSQITTNNEGFYRVVVSNAVGTVVSASARLTLVPTVIVGWGSVFTSSPNPPLGYTNIAGISAGDNFSVALRTDGTLTAWGWNAFSRLTLPTGLSNVMTVSAGGFHGSTLASNGTVVNWGDSFFDAAAVVPSGLSNVTAIAAGDRFNVALKADQTLQVWGNSFQAATNVPAGLNQVVAIGAGRNHGLAVREDGRITPWGSGASGQTNIPPGLNNVVAVDGGDNYSLALDEVGQVFAWGNGSVTNLPANLANIAAIDAGASHALALRPDGTVIAWGTTTSGRTDVPGWLTNVVAISAGYDHSLALLNDGRPFINRHPYHHALPTGATLKFQVVALGQAPLRYQWFLNESPLPAATNSTLVFTNIGLDRAGAYRCEVTNEWGGVSSRNANVIVSRTVPRIAAAGFGLAGGPNFGLRLTELSGHGNILLLTSTNLFDWEAIATNPPIVGELLLSTPSSSSDKRFYKIAEE